MSEFHLAVVPVGKVDPAELEAAVVRVARVLRDPVELRATLPVPPGTEDRQRGQFRAATLMSRLLASVPQLDPGKLLGGTGESKAPPRPDAFVFVTDGDLYTANSDGVFASLVRTEKVGVVSVRRLREAFYRRKADLPRQRTRLVKELLRIAGRLHGLVECKTPQCVLAPSRFIADIDCKEEGFCRACSQRLFQGKVEI